jgi:EpsI family protein
MQKNSLLVAVGLVMVGVAVLANAVMGRLDFPQPRLLPVESFPRRVGEWEGGEDRPVDPAVRKKLATALIVDRAYTNVAGRSVALLMLSATDIKDFHSPQVCFPGQGWRLENPRILTYRGRRINTMIASRGEEELSIWYFWFTDEHPSALPENHPLRPLYNLRMKAVPEMERATLFVRLIASKTPDSDRPLRSFLEAIWEPLQSLRTNGSRAPLPLAGR